MNSIKVSLRDRSYKILVGDGLINRAGSIIASLGIGKDAFVITNDRLKRLYGKALKSSLANKRFSVTFQTIPDSERAKSSGVAIKVVEQLSRFDSKRQLFVIALGGGVVGDLAGFVAAIYKRGIPYVQIPTTLLAQVDSSIGGKVAVDLPVAKNLVGAFYQPRLVLSDVAPLKSLSIRQRRNGLAEIIKYGVIKDPQLFSYIEKRWSDILGGNERDLEYVITRSATIKARLVEMDEYDKKDNRIILNFGHTFGHALETASSYSDLFFHGEAISVGMVVASRIALQLKLVSTHDVFRLISLIKRVGLPTEASGVSFKNLYKAHFHDKKFIGSKNRLVLPRGIGKVVIRENVPPSIIREAIKSVL